MDRKKLMNLAFWLIVALVLALGFSFTVGPNADQLRSGLLELIDQPGNPFRFIAQGLLSRPEAAPEEEPDQQENTQLIGHGQEGQPILEAENPDETPMLTFPDRSFDTGYDVPPEGGGEPTTAPGLQPQNQLPKDVLAP